MFSICLKTKFCFFKRYDYNNNKILILKNLSFLSITLFIIIIRLFKLIIENNSNENNFDINYSKNVSNKKRSTSIFKTLKETKIQKFNLIDIAEIDALVYYYLIRNKENKLFSLKMNEIYDTFIESFEISIKRDNRISVNKLYSYDSAVKYKKCYKSYIAKPAQINNNNVFISQKVLNKLFINY